MDYEDVINMLKFGAVTQNQCEFYLSELVKWDKNELPDTANNFFDMYIEDTDGNLVDVPVLITNFIDSNGNTPNTASDSNQSDWRLVRRFFMYDTISGVD